MELERKSERNQQIYAQRKLERKQRREERRSNGEQLRRPAPRFAPGVEIPEVPEGMELHKFYGKPVFLPARLDGELLVGRTPYTQRQMDMLTILVERRNYELFIKPEQDFIRKAGIDSF